jgi:hypothetical protein
MGRRKLYCHPHARDGEVVLPRSRRPTGRRCSQHQRDRHQSDNGSGTRNRESVCPQGVNQVSKDDGRSQQVAAGGSAARRKEFGHASRAKQQQHGEVKCKGRHGGGEFAVAIAEPSGIQGAAKAKRSPQTKRGKRSDLSSGRQARIVTHRRKPIGRRRGRHRQLGVKREERSPRFDLL